MMVKTSLVMILLVSLVLSGCGGGGSGSSTPVNPKNITRVFTIGDTATYNVTGNLGINGSKQYPVTGTATILVQESKSSKRGRATIADIVQAFDMRETISLTINGQTMVVTGITFLGQDNDHALYLLGESDDGINWAMVDVTDLPMWMPGVITSVSVWNYNTMLDDGSTDSESTNVVGAERVETAAGIFDCFKCSYSGDSSGGTEESGTEWYAPEVGFLVKGDSDITTNDGENILTGHLTMTLKSLHLN